MMHFSKIISGVMTWGKWGYKHDTASMLSLIEGALASGITTFDHADIYGDYTTEADFGKALSGKSHLRQHIQLISKCGILMPCDQRPQYRVKGYDYSYQHIIQSTEQSLKNLQTDFLDVLLLHRPSPLLHAPTVAKAVDDLLLSGKIKAFGVSNFTNADIDLLLAYDIPVKVHQWEISLSHHQAITDGSLSYAQSKGILPMAWRPLGKGTLNVSTPVGKVITETANGYNKTPAQMLLAWLMKHPAGIHPIIGTAQGSRLQEAARIDFDLKNEDWFALYEAAIGKEVP